MDRETETILVTGGTGTLGRAFTDAAENAGYRVRIMSRSPAPDDLPEHREWARADVTTAEGLEKAVRGVDAVLHAASDPTGDPEAVDVKGTRRLVRAAAAEGVDHLLYPSIVGIDRMPYFYYDAKEKAEKIVADAAVPHTTVRITPFHSFVARILSLVGKLPIMPLPTRSRESWPGAIGRAGPRHPTGPWDPRPGRRGWSGPPLHLTLREGLSSPRSRDSTREPEAMNDVELRVGELAERTGLTVRTLHWYDEVGLLTPGRTPAGHRIYGPEQIERLQRILSLRHLGLSLDEIRDALDRPGFSLLEVLELHAERLAEEADRLRGLRNRLDRAIDAVREHGRVEAEELIRTMEAMTMFEKYYTPEQLERLERRKDEVGEERIQEVQDEWRDLYRRLAEARADGAGPSDPEVRELARKAESLIREFTGGDAGIRASLETMYREEGSRPMEAAGWDVDPDVQGFLGRAMKSLREADANE